MCVVQSMIFFFERKLLFWEEKMLPEKLILISGHKGFVVTKSALLQNNLSEGMPV